MSTNNMTPQEVLTVLDIATNPANTGKLSRADYARAEIALGTLQAIVKEHEAMKVELGRQDTPST